MLRLTKRFISKVICLPIVGRVILLLTKQANYFGIKISLENPYINYSNKSAIFWNLYESAEARLVNQYILANYPVIEIGSSLGVISRLIACQLQATIICIEANKRLIPAIDFNLREIRGLNYQVLNRALSYKGEPVLFSVEEGKNLTGRINAEKGDFIDPITLSDIFMEYGFDDFSLVMDIEGSEIEIFINDIETLSKCRLIIMELHNTEYVGKQYSIDTMMGLVEQAGFRLLKRDGNCFAYAREIDII